MVLKLSTAQQEWLRAPECCRLFELAYGLCNVTSGHSRAIATLSNTLRPGYRAGRSVLCSSAMSTPRKIRMVATMTESCLGSRAAVPYDLSRAWAASSDRANWKTASVKEGQSGLARHGVHGHLCCIAGLSPVIVVRCDSVLENI